MFSWFKSKVQKHLMLQEEISKDFDRMDEIRSQITILNVPWDTISIDILEKELELISEHAQLLYEGPRKMLQWTMELSEFALSSSISNEDVRLLHQLHQGNSEKYLKAKEWQDQAISHLEKFNINEL